MSTIKSSMEHPSDGGQSYITVIPVDYTRSRAFPPAQDFLVEPYK